eukprot:6966713-Alexandrium_andersonii.AAC.1
MCIRDRCGGGPTTSACDRLLLATRLNHQHATACPSHTTVCRLYSDKSVLAVPPRTAILPATCTRTLIHIRADAAAFHHERADFGNIVGSCPIPLT